MAIFVTRYHVMLDGWWGVTCWWVLPDGAEMCVPCIAVGITSVAISVIVLGLQARGAGGGREGTASRRAAWRQRRGGVCLAWMGGCRGITAPPTLRPHLPPSPQCVTPSDDSRGWALMLQMMAALMWVGLSIAGSIAASQELSESESRIAVAAWCAQEWAGGGGSQVARQAVVPASRPRPSGRLQAWADGAWRWHHRGCRQAAGLLGRQPALTAALLSLALPAGSHVHSAS